MEGLSRKDEEGCLQLLDLIPNQGEKLVKTAEETSHGFSEEKGLELSLGPPGGDWTIADKNSAKNLSLVHFSDNPRVQNPVFKSPWQQQKRPQFLHVQQNHPQGQGLFTLMEEPSQPRSNGVAIDSQNPEKKAYSTAPANTASSKRTAPAPVVGWPPVRSFRKNLAIGSSSKLASESADVSKNKDSSQKPIENCPKSMFVKINMDGIPIGRKVDLKAYDSYEKLSYAVDELFKDLLAAQNDSSASVNKNKEEGGCLLEPDGKYTLVYEDNEGDRMLVGDVPWQMFISTVKRMRVLKSSELTRLSRGCKQGKLSHDASPK